MRSDWSPEELISSWTLEEADWRLLANKTGATRLGFAVLLRFFVLRQPQALVSSANVFPTPGAAPRNSCNRPRCRSPLGSSCWRKSNLRVRDRGFRTLSHARRRKQLRA